VLRAGGKQRYTGLEVEGLVLPAAGWTIRTHLAWTAAKYRDFFTLVDGAPTQLSGKQQVLTPTWRAGAGVVFAPERGWRGSLTTAWTGKHSLNRMNTAQAPAYAVVDASLGYRFDACTLQLAAANLGNRRDATQQSELGEDQFYRLPARRVDFSLTVPFR
jgi:outer membrane receptor protein involved in Fe transport